VLFTALLMLVVGFALVYAGLSGGDTWKKPWQPFVDQLARKSAAGR
jgi:hypothetical protein